MSVNETGISISATTIRMILRRADLGPAPRRDGPIWHEFLSAQANVERRPDPHDRRGRLAFLTTRGQAVRPMAVAAAVE